MKKVSVSLLVFNEKHNLEETIAKAYKELEKLNLQYELWVFDNCSTDGTDKLVNSLLDKYKYLKYFRQEKNFGYSVNFQTALKSPISDYKFVIDGDGQYDLENIKECIERILNVHLISNYFKKLLFLLISTSNFLHHSNAYFT